MKTYRVFLAGEGTSDIGDLAHQPPFRGEKEGFLQPVLRRIVGRAPRLEFDGAKLTTLAKTKVNVVRKHYARHAAQAHSLAEAENADALVLCLDVDRQAGRKRTVSEARNRIREIVASIEKGLDAARRTADREVPTIVATPCRMIEAWALGDPEALETLIEDRVDRRVLARPEELWGKDDDPAGRHPKAVLARILGDRPDFAVIGEAVDPAQVTRSCPLSFRPFVREIEALLRRCQGE